MNGKLALGENNQTIKADAGKAKLSLVPPQIMYGFDRRKKWN